jgi:hypothetical protein
MTDEIKLAFSIRQAIRRHALNSDTFKEFSKRLAKNQMDAKRYCEELGMWEEVKEILGKRKGRYDPKKIFIQIGKLIFHNFTLEKDNENKRNTD